MIKKLDQDYEIRSIDKDEFGLLWEQHAKQIFEDQSPIFRFVDALSEAECDQIKELGKNMGAPYRLNLGVYHRNIFVGWTFGFQESADTFYMCNSAVLPEHRRKGLYNHLMKTMIGEVAKKGFQRIYSRHSATNNAVIIPKLKAGFVISSFEVTDRFGVSVQLTYFTNETRRKMMDYRVGKIRPDDEIKKFLKL